MYSTRPQRAWEGRAIPPNHPQGGKGPLITPKRGGGGEKGKMEVEFTRFFRFFRLKRSRHPVFSIGG